MKSIIKVLAFSTALAAMISAASAEKLILKFGHVGNPGSLFSASVDEFAKRANAALGDMAEVQVFGSSQLGNDKELLQKLKLGQITFSLPSSVMSSVSDSFGIFEMPYIIKDRDHMKRVQASMGDTFQKAATDNGYRILTYFENGFRHITNNTRPINKPEDLAGIKLRTPKGAWRVKMFTLYGANPTPMAFSDVFTALKTGVIDGQENPYAQIWSAKFQEVQKYLSITGHVYTPAYVVVSDEHFGKLPEDVQKTLMDVAADTQGYVYETAANLETELLDNLQKGGITVNTADKEAFIAASKPIYDEFAGSVEGGKELIEKVQAEAAGS